MRSRIPQREHIALQKMKFIILLQQKYQEQKKINKKEPRNPRLWLVM
jgi:hypothetical protein